MESNSPSQKVDCRGALSLGRYTPLRPAKVLLIVLPSVLGVGKGCGVAKCYWGCGSLCCSYTAERGTSGVAARRYAGWHTDAVISGTCEEDAIRGEQ